MKGYYQNFHCVKEFAEEIKHGFEMAAAGQPFRISWAWQEIKSLTEFHEWFQDNIDKRINHKAGLRTDGASFKKRCHCRHCMGTCDCAINRSPARNPRPSGRGGAPPPV